MSHGGYQNRENKDTEIGGRCAKCGYLTSSKSPYVKIGNEGAGWE